jgi:hypothetical protein
MTASLEAVADVARRGITGETTTEQGRGLEDLACELFGAVPGVEITHRNRMNAFNTEEIDVALWNDQHPEGFFFLPYVVLIECKNWSSRVTSEEVAWFHTKLRNRGLSHGVLLAANGVTGDAEDVTRANFEVSAALASQCFLIVITLEEVSQLADVSDLVRLVKVKLCNLAVSGHFI